MTTSDDRRDVRLDDDRTLDHDDVENGPDLGGSPDEPARTTASSSAADQPLVAEDAAVDYRTRWEVIQQGFVDDPRNAVSEADQLVDDLLKNLADGFDRQHQDLEQQWSDGEPSTEDLRSALQRYRAFFQRLLTL